MGGKEKWEMVEENWGKYRPTWTARYSFLLNIAKLAYEW